MSLALVDSVDTVSRLTPMSYNISSVSTVNFPSGFLSYHDPIVLTLLMQLCKFCLLGNGCPGNLN
jgi:hypothetical protein